jgi:hypothetical protein
MTCSSQCSQCSACGAGGYRSSTVNSAPSSYSNLNSYNKGMQGIQPVVPATTTSGFYVVPDWPYKLSYDTLSKGGCGGYGSIQSAYGAGAENCCPRYKKVPCNMAPQYAACPMMAPQQPCNPDNSAPQLMPVSTCAGAPNAGAAWGPNAAVAWNGNGAVGYVSY